MEAKLVEEICAGSIRAASRLISRAEANDSTIAPILKQLFLRGSETPVIGITGPPGAGKSTLVNRLVQHYRENDRRVAVLAVDPSSPFSGGAILGDRVRMNQHAADPGVFIRSMAARGHLGGLAKASGDALFILQAMDFDAIILETVGIGQGEVEIVRYASSIIVLQIPGAGDGIQIMKAGVLETGDIYAVNKSDLPGSEKLVSHLNEMLHLSATDSSWQAPVLAIQANSGSGTVQLVRHLNLHREFTLAEENRYNQRALERARHRVADICRQLIYETVFSRDSLSDGDLEAVIKRQQDPYTLAEKLVGSHP